MKKFWGRKEIELSEVKPITERPLEWNEKIRIDIDDSTMCEEKQRKTRKEVQ